MNNADPGMRMTWWREAKWLLASHLFNWMLALTTKEMPPLMAIAAHRLAVEFKNDIRFNTVRMRRRQSAHL